jgi:eukaryotic-like serine/threonine-protein kinase
MTERPARPFRTTYVSPSTGCPNDGRIAALVEGRLDGRETELLLAHADACDRCRELVAAVGLGLDTIDASQTPTDAASSRREPTIGERIGRYRIAGVLGRGGMAIVYRARDPDLDREVALKLVSCDSAGPRAQELAARQIREAQALARLNHPHVVPIYDVGVWRGQTFIACERITGSNLRFHLLRERPPWPRVLELLIQAGRGLAAAHAAGLVHRDFKPDNILVGDDGRARLADFGLVRDRQPSLETMGDQHATRIDVGAPMLTGHGEVLGTPAYMAPEQHMGRDVEASADQYAFCLTAYESLFGTRAFAGATRTEVVEAQLAGRIVAPVILGLPERLRHALERGLSPHPAERWPSMNALLVALERSVRPQRARVVGLSVAGVVVVAVVAVPWGSSRESPAPADSEAAPIVTQPEIDEVARAAARARLAEVDALADAQRDAEALDMAESMRAEVEALGDHELRLRLSRMRGSALLRLGRYPEGEAQLTEVFFEARTRELDTIALGAAIELARTVGYQLARTEEGLAWIEHARGLIPPDATEPWEVFVGDATAQVHLRAGRFDAAAEAFEGALVHARAHYGPESPELVAHTVSVAIAWAQSGRLEQARTRLEDALVLAGRTLPADHPKVAWLHANLGAMKGDAGEFVDAVAHIQAAAEITIATAGADHVSLVDIELNLGLSLSGLGRHDEAVSALSRALALAQRHFGGQDVKVAQVWAALGRAELERGERVSAERAYARAISILEPSSAALDLAEARFGLAQVLRRSDREHAARQQAEAAIAGYARLGGDHARARADVERWLEEQPIEKK